MSQASSAIVLPIVTVQHDFQNVVSDVHDGIVPEEDFWVSCYITGDTSVHGKVRVSLGEKDEGGREVKLVSREGIYFERTTRGSFTASCSSLAISSTRVRVPRQVVRDAESAGNTQITALTISPDSTQIAFGCADGLIRRIPLPSSTSADAALQPLSYKPHLSGASITSLRYFPSSRVLLSAGADFAIHVLDADPSLPPISPHKPVRTLKGHIRSVTDTAIVARGRNVLSSAKDGTVRLWDVGSGTQIRVLGSKRYSAINSLSLGDQPAEQSFPREAEGAEEKATTPARTDEREVETAGKLVFVALQDGNFECFDLKTKNSVYHSSSSSTYAPHGPLSAIVYSSSSSLIVSGSSEGVVSAFDARKLSSTLCTFQRNSSSIEDLVLTAGEDAVAIATEDGLPYIAGIRPNGPEVLAELACCGDCDAVRVIATDSSGGIWMAGDDGVIRMY